MRRITEAMAWAAMLGGLGCEGTGVGADGTTRLTLQITDAPAGQLASATITVGAITLLPQGGEPVTIADDAGEFDLLELQDGVTATLASLDVPADRYHQLRLVVRSASVTLADGLTFADGSTTRDLVVPSGAQSGIKINLFNGDWTMGVPGGPPDPGDGGQGRGPRGMRRMGVELVPGETLLVLDFDVSRNFVLTGPGEAPTGAVFTPLIRAVVRDVAGSIGGVVTDAATGEPLSGLTVTASLVQSPVLEALQTAEATAVTADDGSFTLWFLSPGTYTVSVEGVVSSARTVTVAEAEVVSGVDIAITP